MRVALSRSVAKSLLALTVFQLALGAPAVSALQKGTIIVDGRVTIEVEVARTPGVQAKGLGGRSSLRKGTGMVFPYGAPGPQSFWMKGMRFPIDILWIREGRIVAIEANIPPPSGKKPLTVYTHVADLVLEVPAGYSEEVGIKVSQSVKVTYE